MTILRFILFGYAFLAIFISGGFFFKRSGQANLMLSLYALLLGLELFDFLYSTSSLIYIFPQFYGRYYFFSGFLYGPIMYFHLRSLIKHHPFKLTDLVHLIPLFIIVIVFADIWLMPDTMRREYMWDHFIDRVMPINYARATHILAYGLGFFFMIRHNFNKLDDRKRLYAITICAIYFITAVLISWLTEYAGSWREFIYYYLGVTTIVFIAGYILYSKPDFLARITKKYLSSSLDREDMYRIEGKIKKALERDEHFLKRDLTLSKLARIIDEKPHNISQTFSELICESFNDYINRYRVAHAKQMLISKVFDHYKIEAVAIESGFNNKVTFNKAFTKFTSETPTSYKKKHL